ncbi:hypothetical protein VTL71DRAFT_4684 [Oculimacula yallundae]|uniref:DUF6594 domain-containing protein n=1 Tax=Oculimacula yallundae TaxID=86028 RepID=A0ABR4C2P8_9HELO
MQSPNSPISDVEKCCPPEAEDFPTINDGPQMGSTSFIRPLAMFQKVLSWLTWDSAKSENGLRTTQVRVLEGKHTGYRSLGTFLDSDENFMVYRRFGYLHSRTLLRKQDELRKLESELDDYDDYDTNNNEKPCRVLMSRDSDEAADKKEPSNARTRTRILDDIEKKLEIYENILFQVFLLHRIAVERNRDISYMLSIGILLVFTLTFSAILSLFTQAKRHEIFGAAAAYVSRLPDRIAVADDVSYCAVLVVFISNVPGAT